MLRKQFTTSQRFKRPMNLWSMLMVVIAAFAMTFTANAQVIISQYIEAPFGSFPKGIELWNTSGSQIDFTVQPLQVNVYFNGNTSSGATFNLNTGKLNAGEVIVVGTLPLGDYLTSLGYASKYYNFNFTFNGDDAIEVKLGGTVTDVLGTIGVDPGFSWSGANGVSTQDQNIQIKPGITAGAPAGWSDPSSRFEMVAKGNLTGFGFAPGQAIEAKNEMLAAGIFTNSFGTWSTYDNGDASKNWFVSVEGYVEINNFGGTGNCDDWLISPAMDFSLYKNISLAMLFDNFRNATLLPQVVVSTNYDGVGNPNNFTWTPVYTFADPQSASWELKSWNLDSYNNSHNVYVAIHYVGTPTEARDLKVGDIFVTADFKNAGVATGLWAEKVMPINPMVGVPFSVQARLVDANGIPTVMNKDVQVKLILMDGSNAISGNLTKTIPAGVSKVIFDNLTYPVAEKIRVKVAAPANQGGSTVFLEDDDLTFQVMAKPVLSLYAFPNVHIGAVNNIKVSALSEYGLPNQNYDGYNVTLTITGGAYTGTTTRQVKGGMVNFDDIVFNDAASYTVQASAPFLGNSNVANVSVLPMFTMSDVIVPKYVKSFDNNALASFALVKFTGLHPNTVYRYVTGLVSTIPFNDRASYAGGSDYHKQWYDNYYTYTSYKYIDNPNNSSTFMSDGSGNANVWLNEVSADYGDIAEGTNYYWMVEVGTPDGTYITRTFTTAQSKAISLGSAAAQGSGWYDINSPNVTRGNFIVAYDQNDEVVTTALVQGTGLIPVANNAPWFYHQNENGSWATILPNNLPGGVRRIDEVNWNGTVMNEWTDDDGIWAGYNTASQSYGVNPPNENDAYRFALPKFQITYPGGGLGSDVCNEDGPESINWTSVGVGMFDIYISINGLPYEIMAEDVDARDMWYEWDIQRNLLKNANVQLKIVPYDNMTMNGNPVEWYSNKFNVFDAPMVTSFSDGIISCVNDSVTILCTAEGSDLQYQWYKDGKAIAGATKDIYTMNKIQHRNSGVYTCMVYNYHGCPPQWTGEIAVYTARGTSVIEQPKDQKILLGNKATFAFKAQVNGAPDNHPVYQQYDVKVQWYKKTTSGDVALSNNDRIAGAKADYMTINGFTKADEGTYYARVWGLCGDWVQTDDVNLTEADIQIVTAPTDAEACQMSDVTLSGEAQTNMTETIHYTWMKDGKPLLKGMKYEGVDTKDLTIHNVMPEDAGIYTLVASLGNTGQTDKASATVTVKPLPIITQQPQNVDNVQTTEPFILEVQAQGDNLTYQWYKDGAEVKDSINSTFSVASAALTDAGDYYCEITNDCGTVNSQVVKVTVVSGNIMGVEDAVVSGYKLSAVTPNPVSESARVDYYMAKSGNVRIAVIDALGNEVAVVADQFQSEGTHNLAFNLANVNLTSGAYYVSMQANGVKLSKPFMVVK